MFTMLKRKMLAILIGTALFVILFEIGIRVTGAFHLREVRARTSLGETGCDHIILCLGDSFTYGLGAPRGMSYPRQLEELLNTADADRKFCVLNKGIDNRNTAEVLRNLPTHLDNYQPELVILQIGTSNQWNFRGYRDFLKRRAMRDNTQTMLAKKPDRSFPAPSSSTMVLHDFLSRSRVYRLFRLLWLNFRKTHQERSHHSSLQSGKNQGKEDEGVLFITEGAYDDAITWYKAALARDPRHSAYYHGMGTAYEALGNHQEALVWFMIGIEINPQDGRNFAGMGRVYQNRGDFRKALEWYRKAVKAAPQKSPYVRDVAWMFALLSQEDEAIRWFRTAIENNPGDIYSCSELANLYDAQGRHHEALDFFRTIAGYNPEVNDFVTFIEQRETARSSIEPWIESDLKEITRICRERNVRLIMQNYPKAEGISRLLRDFAEAHGISFIDQYRLFNRLLHSGETRASLLSADDDHYNARGYSIVAREVYETIVKEGWFGLR